MTDFFLMIFNFMRKFLELLDSHYVELFGYDVSLLSLIFVFIVFGFVINVFWRGAKE